MWKRLGGPPGSGWATAPSGASGSVTGGAGATCVGWLGDLS